MQLAKYTKAINLGLWVGFTIYQWVYNYIRGDTNTINLINHIKLFSLVYDKI